MFLQSHMSYKYYSKVVNCTWYISHWTTETTVTVTVTLVYNSTPWVKIVHFKPFDEKWTKCDPYNVLTHDG